MFESLLLSTLLVSAKEPHTFSHEDLIRYKCDKGNESACQELEAIQADKQRVEYLNEQVKAYAEELEAKQLMLDHRRPDLAAAYPFVMRHYFNGLDTIGSEEQLASNEQLFECASHYHNHWINKKLWWPNDEGKPDWVDIYVFIVDHYYGYCVKRY